MATYNELYKDVKAGDRVQTIEGHGYHLYDRGLKVDFRRESVIGILAPANSTGNNGVDCFGSVYIKLDNGFMACAKIEGIKFLQYYIRAAHVHAGEDFTMITRKIPYTDKFPFMYQIVLKDYIIESTDEGKFNNLVEYMKVNCLDDMYSNMPESKKVKVIMSFNIRRAA